MPPAFPTISSERPWPRSSASRANMAQDPGQFGPQLGEPVASSIPARMLVALFRSYQAARIGRVSPCRFTPTCSNYAIEAVHRHGARRGLSLAAHRLARCRPGGPFGLDPVPE